MMVPFMDHLSYAMPGTAFFAIKTNALVVCSYVSNRMNGKVDIHMDEPFLASLTENHHLDLYTCTTKIFNSFEKQLLKAPEHWMYLPELYTRLDYPLPTNSNASNNEIEQLTRSLGIN